MIYLYDIIGRIVLWSVIGLSALAACAWLYFNFLHGRFGLIFFRKSERRLSIASWHRSKLSNADEFLADDWVVNERPFYFAYWFNGRRYFVLLGFLKGPRHSPIRGEHP